VKVQDSLLELEDGLLQLEDRLSEVEDSLSHMTPRSDEDLLISDFTSDEEVVTLTILLP